MGLTDLRLHDRGADVRNLHGELGRLGIAPGNAEVEEGVFGATTRSAVRNFQASAGLVQTGVLDSLTRAALDEALQSAAYTTPRVEGRLVTERGTPAANVPVRLYRRLPGGKAERVGEGLTGADGHYRLDHPAIPGRSQTIELRILDRGRTEIPISRPKPNAARYELLNLVVPASAVPPLEPEWDRLVDAVEDALGGFDALTGADDDVDALAVAHAHTGWDARLLALAGAAAEIADRSKLDRRAAYALVRYGLPTDAAALATVPTEEVRAVLGRAVDDGVVVMTPGEIRAQSGAFAQFATRTRHGARRPGAVSTYGDFLAGTGLDDRQQARFDRLVVEHAGDPDSLWRDALAAGIGDAEIRTLQSQGRFAELTSHNLPLTSKLLEIDRGRGGLRALAAADLHTPGAWMALLDELAGPDDDALTALVPQDYLDGATPREAATAYAGDLAERVRTAVPTTVVVRMLRSGEIDVDPPLREPVAHLVEKAEGLDFTFASRPLGPFLAIHRAELVAGLDPAVADSAVAQLERVQRLYRATPSHDALAAAVAAGFGSAHQIAMIDQRTFLERHGKGFPSLAAAELTHQRSRRIMAITLAHTGATMQSGGPTIYALSRPPEVESAVEAVLGEQDFCACEHCRSLLGPAAYFVDLLHFLDIDEASWQALPSSQRPAGPPFEELIKRRPDLEYLPLTCENTNTALPYIDVVNEIMEARVAPEALGASVVPDTGAATSADLLAEPRSVLPEAYVELAEALYPVNLPFDLWLETVRGHLGRLGLTHADLLDALRPDQDALYPADAVLTERLGLTPLETGILTDATPLDQWHLLYGYDTAAEASAELRNARTLARRLGISYLELDALVKTWFVNPELDGIGALRTIGLDVVDLLRSTGAEGVLPFDHGDEPFHDERDAFEARLDAATQRFRQDGAPWGDFDARAWAATASGLIDNVLVLTSTENACRFDTTVVRAAGSPERTVDIELVRLNLMVRLWRRLDWTLDELDLTLRALIPAGAAGLSEATLGGAMAAAVPALSTIAEIARRLGLGPRQRVDLLTLGGPMPTVGPRSTYHRLFLAPRPVMAFDDPTGAYLDADPDRAVPLLAEQRTVVQGAIGLSAADVDAVLAASGLDPATANLTLDTVSQLHRHALLARATGLDVGELIALRRLFDIDPFAQTLHFLDAVDDLGRSGLTVADLDYLFRHRFDPVGPFRPDPAAVRALVVAIGDGLRRLEAEHAVPSDPALLADDVVVREWGLVLPADLAGRVVALWQGTLVLAEQGELLAAIRWLVPDDAAQVMFGPPPDGVVDHERRRRASFAEVVMPRVLATLRRRFVMATVAAALDAAAPDPVPGAVEALLTETDAVDAFAAAAASGLSVVATDLADAPLVPPGTVVAAPVTPAVPQAATIVVDGYVRVPVTGTYQFELIIDGAGDTASLSIGDGGAPLVTATGPADGASLALTAGPLHRFTLEAHRQVNGVDEPLAGTVSVQIGDLIVDGASVGPPTGLSWWPSAAVDTFTAAHLLTSKAVLLAGRLRLSARELRRLGLVGDPADRVGVPADGAEYGLLGHLALREEPADVPASAAVRGLLSYVALRAEMAGGSEELVDVLAAAVAPGIEPDVYARIAALTRRDEPTVTTVADHLRLARPALAGVPALRRLWDALALVARLGIGPDAVIAAATPTPDQSVAEGLRDAVRAGYGIDAWRALARSVHDPLRRRRRDALVTYLLHHLGRDPGRPELLYDELLLDPGTEPVVQTSRLRLAISSVQLFVQRCLLNLEPTVRPAVIDKVRWDWMKRYRVWEANRKIFLYPENWLEPELRDDRSHLFSALTGALLQGDVTDRLAEDAFATYLRGLADIARLDIVCVWQEQHVLHVIGRDYNDPRSYYYRRQAGGRWTPWEQIGAQIEGDHVAAAMFRGRLHVFWVTFLAQGTAVDADNNDTFGAYSDKKVRPPEVDVSAQLHWTELISGQWTPRASSRMLALAGPLVAFDPAEVFVSASVHRTGGADVSVTVHLDGGRHVVDKGLPQDRYFDVGGKPTLKAPIQYGFRFVSRNGAPGLAQANGPTYSVGLEHYSRSQRWNYSAPLVASSSPNLKGGTVLAESRAFAAVASPQPAAGSERADMPFFYVDHKVGTHHTFFVERTRVTATSGWLPPLPPFGIGDAVPVRPVVPPQLNLLVTGQPVLVPADPTDALSIIDVVEPADWVTVPDGEIVVGGVPIGPSGRVRNREL